METVLSKLKIYMKEKGLTIYKLTELSELSENTIYNWYNKGAEPSLHALSSICKILGISMSELFSEDENETFTQKEIKLIQQFRNLSESKKELVIKLLEELDD